MAPNRSAISLPGVAGDFNASHFALINAIHSFQLVSRFGKTMLDNADRLPVRQADTPV